jgi:hypothetical protein
MMPMTVPTMMTVPTVVPMPVMTPAHFLRLEMIDLGLRHDSRLHGLRLRRSIGNADQCHSTRCRSDCEFDEVAKFHEISLPKDDK